MLVTIKGVKTITKKKKQIKASVLNDTYTLGYYYNDPSIVTYGQKDRLSELSTNILANTLSSSEKFKVTFSNVLNVL